MIIPSLTDKLVIASYAFRDETYNLIEQGVSHDDDRIHTIARKAIFACVPEIRDMLGGRLTMEGLVGVGRNDDMDAKIPFAGLHVEGVLSEVHIEQIIDFTDKDTLGIEYAEVDLCAVLTPVYRDPDPIEITMGNKLYVPFGAVTDAKIIEN